MKITKLLAVLGILAMSAILFYGFTVGDFFEDGALIMQNPWGIVSLVDLYTGFILFSIWIAFREQNILLAILWISAMMIFGFLTGSVYVLYAASTSNNDPTTFFLGKKASIRT